MTEEEKAEARKVARRASYNASARRRFAERQKAGLCTVCGKAGDDIGTGDSFKNLCLRCTEHKRRREILRWEAKRKLSGAIKLQRGAWYRKVSVRVCRYCKGRDLIASGPPFARSGKQGKQRQRFLCRGCSTWSYGVPLPPIPECLCPYCRGRCTQVKVLKSGSQVYQCKKCGRRNTDSFPRMPRDTNGPFRRRKDFYLGPLGAKALTEYCNRRQMQVSRAIREILREATVPLVAVSATAQREWPIGSRWQWSHVRVQKPEPIQEPLPNTSSRLPDIRRYPSGIGHRTVAVVCKVTVALDDRSWAGLIRTMRMRNIPPQEAMRQLLMEAWRRL